MHRVKLARVCMRPVAATKAEVKKDFEGKASVQYNDICADKILSVLWLNLNFIAREDSKYFYDMVY